MNAAVRTPRNVPALLNALYDAGHDGTVLVTGAPGGRIHLRKGLVIAVDTPGAPSVESVLLKSGRVEDEPWTAACAACDGREGRLGDELEARGLLGRAEFEIVCTAAVFDAAFALTLGPPGDWEVADVTAAPVSGPGFAPRRLAAETNRRLALIDRMWGPPAEFARTRIRPAAALPVHVPPRYAALLRVINGRRTPRDVAFAVGRGTYAVMLDLAQMHELGLVRPEVPGTAGRPSTAPRLPGDRTVPPPEAVQLPRRRPGAHPLHREDGA
ncbi:hypothetical protein [Streptomyces sp. NPDC047000]|uniref:hypothetical protein n=1 Tax=Streptomyces sp. NPDC047000 TaxID=3155474 RepID=UPI0033EB56DC